MVPFFFLSHFHRCDSITWNPHKLMGALLQCSTIHFKEDVSSLMPPYTGMFLLPCTPRD